MSLYMKLFLAAAIPYGLVAALLMQQPVFGVLFGLGIGIVIASIFGTLQHTAFNGKKADADRSVHQVRDIELDLPYHEAYNLCMASLGVLNRAFIKQADESTGTIEARTAINWKTYGERVSFRLVQVSRSTTIVHIESRPRLKTTLIDYGSNLYNLNCVSLFLRQHTSADNLPGDYRHLEIDEAVSSPERLMDYNEMVKERG